MAATIGVVAAANNNANSAGKVVQITNIAPQATRDQMHTLFGFLGKIEDIRLYPTIRDVAVPVQSRICYVKFTDPVCVGIAQHMTNTVFIDRALIVVPFQNEIPDEQRALELTNQGTMVPGLFPVEPKWPQNVTNQLEGTPPNQVVITHDPRLVQHNLPLYPPLPGTLDFRRVEEIRRTVLVLNIDDAVTTEEVIDFFNNAGEVKYARFCSKEGDSEKFVLVEFTDQNSLIAALQMNGKEFAGNIIKVFHSTQAIVKPQAKSNEAAQKEIEEAMSRVKEAQNLISAAIDPVIGLLAKEKKRSRSRSRSRRSRSQSRGRRRSRSRSRRTRSRSRRRSRNRRSRSRRRSRSISKRTRSRSRDRKRRSSRSPRRRRSRSRSRSRRSRSRSRSHSKSKSKSSKSHDKKDKKDEKRDSKKEPDKDVEGKPDDVSSKEPTEDGKEGKGEEREKDLDKSKYKVKEKDKGKDKDKARDKSKSSRGKSSSRSPSKSRHRKSRSPTGKKGGSPSRRKSPHSRPKSPSPSRHGASHSRRRSKSPRAGGHSRHSPGHRRSGSQSKPPREEKKKEMDRGHEKDKREKEDRKRDRRDDKGGEKSFGTKVPRNYDEEEEGFDANEQDRRDGDRDGYGSSSGNQSYQDGDHSNGRDPRQSGHHSENNADDMDISTSP